jgi:hypothetical protein
VRIGAIFVDAGYLFSAGSDVVFGHVHRRRELLLRDPAGLFEKLTSIAADCCDDDENLRILRSYWYDGAVNGLPAPDQITVGNLPRVKLRLGRINAGGQKGVDGLIILDLITLATNRAIDAAIVVGGDEDLREAALHAQSFGVSVVLVGLPPTRQQRQSELLVRESDHHLVLDAAVMATHLELSSTRSVPPVEESAAGVPTAPPLLDSDTTARLRKVADELVADPPFRRLDEIVSSDGMRLTRRADRVLVARLAELTGRFPVEKQLRERARAATVEPLCRNAAALP